MSTPPPLRASELCSILKSISTVTCLRTDAGSRSLTCFFAPWLAIRVTGVGLEFKAGLNKFPGDTVFGRRMEKRTERIDNEC